MTQTTDKPIAKAVAAATIMLLRDGPQGLEVFMVVRHHQIDFASGALVFPGGKVDPQDSDERVVSRLAAYEKQTVEHQGSQTLQVRVVEEEGVPGRKGDAIAGAVVDQIVAPVYVILPPAKSREAL